MRSAQEIWEAALGELQLQVNKPNYRTWFQGTKGIAYEDGRFTVAVPNTFVAEYLDRNQRSLIEKTLIGLTHNPGITVLFQTGGACPGRAAEQEEAAPDEDLQRLNPQYTFEKFVVGPSNRLAHAAALGVAQNPGKCYNPLFIFGGAGLGKTHLLQAIGHAASNRHLKVLYLSGERFTNDFVDALRQHRMDEFRARYRSGDILMIDDIQFIGGKEQTAESFFHTFNEMHDTHRQIVLSSDRPPKSIPMLEDRLRSRFEWGLTVSIKPPDLPTRLAILKAKSEEAGAGLSTDVLELIANEVRENIRELEGSLNRIIAYARLLRAQVTPEIASQALADIGRSQPGDNVEPLLLAVADCFGLTPEDLCGQKRDKQVAMARQVAMYLLKQNGGLSLAEIGRKLGGRNPSTVSHACEKISKDIESSPVLKHKLLSIQKDLELK